jgi:hypothetical protein
VLGVFMVLQFSFPVLGFYPHPVSYLFPGRILYVKKSPFEGGLKIALSRKVIKQDKVFYLYTIICGMQRPAAIRVIAAGKINGRPWL